MLYKINSGRSYPLFDFLKETEFNKFTLYIVYACSFGEPNKPKITHMQKYRRK